MSGTNDRPSQTTAPVLCRLGWHRWVRWVKTVTTVERLCWGFMSNADQNRTTPTASWDIDNLVGAVIDAYTLAPGNDEDEKREAVKATIIRSGWIQDVTYD